ncbi:MAG TPA: MBL fold metallo-hydrolase [Vicinamibacterales bacterium]|nr:MBL fold metallo-hydrolase [Vicinamibacterales bacterium]
MSPAKVTFLGTGTSHGVPMIGCGCATCHSTDPRDRRLRPSIYIDIAAGPALLVDTATDLRQQALTHRLSRLDAILFTHSHADHVMGFDEVRRFNMMQGGAIPAYADARTSADLRRMFDYVFTPPDQKGGGVPQIELKTIDGPFTVAGVAVRPVPVLHGQRPILGFRFGALAYLTDCNHIPDQSLAMLDGLDVLVLDALRHRAHPTHFNVEQALAVVARVQPRQTYFTHICHDLPHVATNATLPPGVALAYDGLVLDVEV